MTRTEGGILLSIPIDDFLWYIDSALDQMTDIIGRLGDDVANTRPELEGANSPYAILAHCLGVMEYWGGEVVAGRTIERDRDAEFRAHGPVGELLDRTAAARRQLEADMDDLDSLAPPRTPCKGADDDPAERTRGGVLVHILEELFQHLGQMELSRDVLVAARRHSHL